MTDSLFDTMSCYGRALGSHASARTGIGDVAELYACAALGMERQAIDGRKSVCIDAEWNGRPVEIKSVGKNNRALIYKWRMEKDLKEHGDTLVYVFVRHDCLITVKNSAEIVCHFIKHPPKLILTSVTRLHETLKGEKLRKFSMFEGGTDTRIGYNRAGYSEGGWQFSLARVSSPFSLPVRFQWAAHTIETTAHFDL